MNNRAPQRTRDDRYAEVIRHFIHDLRGGLSVVMNSAAVLDGRQMVQPEGAQWLQRIESQAMRLAEIASDFGMVLSGGARLMLEPAQPAALLRKAGASCAGAFKEAPVNLELQGTDQSAALCVDASLVERALRLQLENALHRSAPHSTVFARLRLIEQDGAVTGAEYEVTDSGSAFPEESRERVNDPEESSRLRSVGAVSSGIFLLFGDMVAGLHGGRLEPINQSDGVTFRLTVHSTG